MTIPPYARNHNDNLRRHVTASSALVCSGNELNVTLAGKSQLHDLTARLSCMYSLYYRSRYNAFRY